MCNAQAINRKFKVLELLRIIIIIDFEKSQKIKDFAV